MQFYNNLQYTTKSKNLEDIKTDLLNKEHLSSDVANANIFLATIAIASTKLVVLQHRQTALHLACFSQLFTTYCIARRCE